MPRYFFDFNDGTEQIDDEGTVLTHDEAALNEARRAFASIIKDDTGDVWADGSWTMRVRNERGVKIAEMTFSASTRATGAPLKASSS